MNGIILINKEKNYTSRDIVNIIGQELKTKKVGHFGTLDPLATGLLVIGVGKYTKIGNIIEDNTKEYEVEVLLGISTDTYDIMGNIVQQKKVLIEEQKLKQALNSFKGKYFQTVPLYSAVKINGKKLYEYARNNIQVELPKKEVEIFNISNFNFKDNIFSFKCLVSKGTYIRSLINDLSIKLAIPMCLNNLKRTKCGIFSLQDAYTLKDIKNKAFSFFDISKIFDYKRIPISEELERKLINGNKIENIYGEKRVIFTKSNEYFVLYEQKENLMYPIFFF